MNDDYKRGLITGLAMQPLIVTSSTYDNQPVIHLPLQGSLENTGTDKTISITAEGDAAITYCTDDGIVSYAASANNDIKITGCSDYLSGDFTLILKFKIADNGLPPYYQYRRIVWCSYDSKYTGAEIGYSGSSTLNNVCIAYNGTNLAIGSSQYNDGSWHTLILRKYFNSMHLTVDGLTITANSNVFYNASDYIILSSVNYTLNGCIRDFRLYNHILSDNDLNF